MDSYVVFFFNFWIYFWHKGKKNSGNYFITNIYHVQLYKKLYEKSIVVKARHYIYVPENLP